MICPTEVRLARGWLRKDMELCSLQTDCWEAIKHASPETLTRVLGILKGEENGTERT